MERKKLVILGLVLVVIAALYVLALGIGLSRNDREYSASEQKDGIAGRIMGLLGGLAPRLEVSDLKCRQGQREQGVAAAFRLTEQQPSCDIHIPSKNPPPSYRKTYLRIFQGNTPVPAYIGYVKPERELPLDMPCKHYGRVTARPRLELVYYPAGKEVQSNTDLCWAEQEGEGIDFTIMGDGGDLKLRCVGCTQRPQRFITMRLE